MDEVTVIVRVQGVKVAVTLPRDKWEEVVGSPQITDGKPLTRERRDELVSTIMRQFAYHLIGVMGAPQNTEAGLSILIGCMEGAGEFMLDGMECLTLRHAAFAPN